MLYRKVASARRAEEIDRVLDEAADRYGPPPESVRNLADYGRIRVMADELGVESIDREASSVVIKFRPRAKVDVTRLVGLIRHRPDLTLMPPSGLRLSLAAAQPASEPKARRPDVRLPASSVQRTRKPGPSDMAPSWWTARAKTGDVTPGFTKAEILKPQKDDPRGAGGVFQRLGELLSTLADRG